MAVDVIRYHHGGTESWGVLDGPTVRPVLSRYPTTRSFITEAADAVRRGEHPLGEPIAVVDTDVLSPVTTDAQFICQAINYRTHMAESGFDPRTSPFNVFFRKASSSIAGPTTDVVSPPGVEYLDHEVEIGLVLGSDVDSATTVTAEDLADHVAALVALNDVSARDLQLAETQFYKSKSFRTFGPTGPHLTLVDAGDLARFAEIRLRLWVNGELRQDELAADMIHRPAATLTELSSVQDWRAGDLLATGTPGGCALHVPTFPLRAIAQIVSPARRLALVRRSAARNDRRLRPGDLVELHVGTDDGAIDLGRQRTRVVVG